MNPEADQNKTRGSGARRHAIGRTKTAAFLYPRDQGLGTGWLADPLTEADQAGFDFATPCTKSLR